MGFYLKMVSTLNLNFELKILYHMKNRILLLVILALSALSVYAGQPTKVACIGNSITYGVGVANREKDSYPMMLSQMLGPDYEVRNFGVSAKTMIRRGKSYMSENAFQQALDYNPDVLLVKLGTNDTNPVVWKYKGDFINDMTELVNSFRKNNPSVRVYLCYPVTIYTDKMQPRERVLTAELIPMIDKAAKKLHAATIDLHTPTMGMADGFADALHPNEKGAKVIAETIYTALTGEKKTHVTQPFPGFKSSWKGYDRYDFKYKNRDVVVVVPEKALEGNPWIWRPAFFGAFANADEALLKKGFHVVYHNMTHEYGCPSSIKAGTDFYNSMVSLYGFSPKVALEGLSRGGYYALRWAAANPQKVASLYLDNPVCDIFSWPGKGRAKEWNEFTSLWGIENPAPESFNGNPIHNLRPLAENRVPILAVCGDSDKVVPFADNMKLLRDEYVRLGGPIRLIMKPGADHHPHGLENPEAIVDFVVSHTPEFKSHQKYVARGSLQNSLVRFEKEKKGRVVFFGGSITHMKGWRDMIKEQLQQRFPDAEFEFVEQGLPSAGTTPHAFRMAADVLSAGPVDLMFIEGVVNDYGNGFTPEQQVRGMEGVVRHALEANPYTDIVMLHFIHDKFIDMFAKGQVPDVIMNHDRVANHYLIPSINCAGEVSERINRGEFTWKEFGGIHPSWEGHKYYAAAINDLFDTMWNDSVRALNAHEIPQLLDKFSFVDGKYVDMKSVKVKNGWSFSDSWKPDDKAKTRPGFVNVPMLHSTVPGATFTVPFTGSAVGLFMACGPRSGVLEYKIDDAPFKEIDTNTAWSHNLYIPWLHLLAEELDDSVPHKLTLRLKSTGIPTQAVIRNIVVSGGK